MRQYFIISLFIQHLTLEMYVHSWFIALDILFISQESSKSTEPPERSNPLRNTLCLPETLTNSVLVTTSTFSRIAKSVILPNLLVNAFTWSIESYNWNVYIYIQIFSTSSYLTESTPKICPLVIHKSLQILKLVFLIYYSMFILCFQLSKCLGLFFFSVKCILPYLIYSPEFCNPSSKHSNTCSTNGVITGRGRLFAWPIEDGWESLRNLSENNQYLSELICANYIHL